MGPESTQRKRGRDAVAKLVSEFDANKSVFKDPRKFDEAKARIGFIDPFFEALGWDVKDDQRRVGKQRQVIVEDRAGTGLRQRPDYGFYVAGELKFLVEAKQPARDLANDAEAAFQLKSYVWSQRVRLGLLTDFEELLTFHGAFKPRREKPALGKVERLCLTYEAYVDRFELLFDTFSREAVIGGSIERVLAELLAATARQRGQLERDLFKIRGARAVDADFLEALSRWREVVAKELAKHNSFRDGSELTEAVQRIINRIVFARVAEDRGIERQHTLARAVESWERDGKRKPLYGYLIELFEVLAPQLNGGLFSPHPLSDRAVFSDDRALEGIIKSLYFPESAYRFDVMPVAMLGAVYERFLGSVVRVTEGGSRAKIEEKPEVRHAGGVYYTPKHIVDTIVDRTIGPLLKRATPEKALALRILDPACGSGSFLLGAFQYLIDWHLQYYARSERPEKSYRKACYRDTDGNLRLTLQRKREILTSCLFGVDIDAQAVEVAQMSLYLKLLEDEAEETLSLQRSLELFKADKYLPDLSKNIRYGNSLIGSQDLDPNRTWSDEDIKRINSFDWHAHETGFGEIVRAETEGGHGGFDAIIGNPPYIRVQALTQWAPIEVDLYRQLYRSAADGNYDIYVVFIERCISLLRSTGRFGFIVPSKWWQATYGAGLRKLLGEGRNYSEVMDFAHEQVFEDPTTYTCVSIFTAAPAPAVEYARVPPDALRWKLVDEAALYQHKVPWSALGGEAPWYPGVRGHLRKLFDRLRSTGPFLGDKEVCARVFQGLKTSLDPVYVMDIIELTNTRVRAFSSALDEEVALERGVVRFIVKGGEMKRFAALAPEKLILFPYSNEGGKQALMKAEALEGRYPQAWEYLNRNKAALELRERGRFRGDNWYQFGRSQALDVVALPKLLTADLRNHMAFSIDRTGELFLLGGAAGGYGLIPAEGVSAMALLALLNSRLLEWLLRPPGLSTPFRGGWFSCEARFINLLPIRLPDHVRESDVLRDLALRAVEAHRSEASARSDRDRALFSRQVEAIEAEIDERVFRLYDVGADERRAVNESVTEARSQTDAGAGEPQRESATE